MDLNKYKEYSVKYLELRKIDMAYNTYLYDYRVTKAFLEFWEESEHESLTPLLVYSWKIYLSKHIAKRTILEYMNAMKRFFEFCRSMNYTSEKNHFAGLGNYNKLPSLAYDLPLTHEHVAQILTQQTLETKKPLRDLAFVQMLLTTALRVSELIELKVSDVDLTDRWVRIKTAKGKFPRFVSFPQCTANALKNYLDSPYAPPKDAESPFLFGCNRVHNKPTEWRKSTRKTGYDIVVRTIELITGVENVSPHDLRHISVAYMLHRGVSLELIQATLGHANFTTTQIYTGRLHPKKYKDRSADVFEVFADFT